MCVLSYSGAFIYSCWLYIAESSLKASLLFVYIKLNLLRFVSFATIQFQLRRLTVRSTIILMCMRILDLSCFRSAGRLPSPPTNRFLFILNQVVLLLLITTNRDMSRRSLRHLSAPTPHRTSSIPSHPQPNEKIHKHPLTHFKLQRFHIHIQPATCIKSLSSL